MVQQEEVRDAKEHEEQGEEGGRDRRGHDDEERSSLLRNEQGETKEREDGLLIASVSGASLLDFAPLYDRSFAEEGYDVGDGVLAGALHEVAVGLAEGRVTLFGAWRRPLLFAPPVGMIEMRRGWAAPFGEHVQLARLYVRPDRRRQGVAHALLKEALLSVPDLDLPVLFTVDGPQLPRSYRRLSAQPVATIGLGSLAQAKEFLRRR